MPGGRTLTARVWQASVGRVPLLLLDSDIEENEADLRGVTDRLYGGDQDQRIRQEILVGVGGVRAVRRYCELTGHPAPEVFHTNEGHAGYLGLERIRELQDSAGLAFDEALAAVRAGTVFTTHTPVPAGIDRFPIEMVKHYFGPRTAGPSPSLLPGVPMDRILALGAESNPNMFNMAHMGLRLAQRANGVSQLHGAVSRGMFGNLWDGFRRRRGADRLGDQRRARTDLGGPGDHRADRGAGGGRLGGGLRLRAVGAARAAARPAGGRGAPPGPGGLAAARRVHARAGLDRPRVRPGGADRRLRPPGAHLQAAHPDAAGQGPAAWPAARPAPAGAAGGGRQEPPGRRRRQGAHPGDRPVRRRPGGAAPDRVPARLRHVDGPLPVLGLRRVAEQPAAAAGGVRYVRHEVGAQRRAQPVHPGRLVGRALRRGQRLGHPDRGRHRGPDAPRRPGGQRALRAAGHPGRPGVLRAHRRRGAGALGGAGPAHADHPATPGAGPADGPRVRRGVVRPGGQGGGPDRRRRLRPGPRAGRLPGPAERSLAAGHGESGWTPPGCRTPPRWGPR